MILAKMEEFCSLNLEECQGWLKKNDEKAFRASQIFDWIYKRKVTSFEEMTNLSKGLRAKLLESFQFPSLQCLKTQHSDDGETIKFLWKN